jgi:hypothetical protein
MNLEAIEQGIWDAFRRTEITFTEVLIRIGDLRYYAENNYERSDRGGRACVGTERDRKVAS